jgi:hypothetical protein
MAEFWYNSSFHSALGCSPFKASYKTEPNFGALPPTDQGTVAEDTLLNQQNQTELLRSQLAKAHNRLKLYADAVSLGSGVFYGLDKRLNCWGSTKWHL